MSARELSISNRHPRLRVDQRALRKAMATLDAAAKKFHGGCPPGELSLVFLTDEKLAKLHGDFLADPSITDVITFEGAPTLGFAGEVCISVDAAVRQLSMARANARSGKPAAKLST